ncbi:MAG TPA: D-alanyl-D-alanine carboxypeptidase, partial [Armatimonadota bacterium]
MFILGLCLTTAMAVEPEATTPLIAAKAAIVMDRQTGVVLWSYNPDLPLPMASTTKIMTAMVILDHGGDKLDQSVTVSQQAAGTGGSS